MVKLSRIRLCTMVAPAAAAFLAAGASGGDWPSWRGPAQTGVSFERGLISEWSPESGENVIWRADLIGRSTPVVVRGRVFAMGRAGEGSGLREEVVAFDAGDGRRLWSHNMRVANTTVPFNRAGWASPAADLETGYIYVQGIAGTFVCFDQDGNVVWQRELAEEFGRFSGYGGRTHTPLVDEDKVILSVINSSWGSLGAPRHRYYAFDKRSGEVIWISTPGGNVYDRNTQSNGVVAVIGGQRLIISGNADGHIYALKARTGEKVWGFELSKRGINSTPVVAGTTVIVGHSEENLDEGTLGRTVAIDGTGEGDVTKTHEKWRRDIKMGFPSALVRDDRVYVIDNGGNLYALDVETGAEHWKYRLGTVGKSSPVWADGKIFAPETNGRFHILKPGALGVTSLDQDEISVPGGRYAEIYASPAIAYGRVYLATEAGLFCLGDKEAAFEPRESALPPLGAERLGGNKPAVLHIVPADLTARVGDEIHFEVRAFSSTGQSLGTVDAEWSLDGLAGKVAAGRLTVDSAAAFQVGHVHAKAGDLEATARLRVFGDLPYHEDFDSVEGRGRPYWIGAGRYQVTEVDGNKVLEKPVAPAGLLRSNLLIGPPGLKNYTIQAEAMGNQKGRRRTDMGLINGGYVLDLQGNAQKLQIRTWTAMLRMAKTIDFPWEMGQWYVMKLRVDSRGDTALVRGKVWPKGDPEPEEWTISAQDPLPIEAGAPGVQGYSPASIYFDNVVVTPNEASGN